LNEKVRELVGKFDDVKVLENIFLQDETNFPKIVRICFFLKKFSLQLNNA